MGRLASPLPASLPPNLCDASHLVMYFHPLPACLKYNQIRSCCWFEFESRVSLLYINWSYYITRYRKHNTSCLSALRKLSQCAAIRTSQLPISRGQRSSQGKGYSGHCLRIKLLFPHENFIHIASQINTSAKLKGRLFDKMFACCGVREFLLSTGSVQQVVINDHLQVQDHL